MYPPVYSKSLWHAKSHSKNQRPYGKPVLKVQCSRTSSGIETDYHFFKSKEKKDRTIKTLHDLTCTK